MKHAILLLAWLGVMPLHAQERSETVSTVLPVNAEGGKGAALRPRAGELGRMLSARQFDQAREAAVALCTDYESLFDRRRKQYVFESASEFAGFSKSDPGKGEWIDWGYKQCLHTQAFIAAERKDFSAALAMLARIEALVPVSAGTSTEIAYILGQLKRPEESLAAYRRALATTQKYPSQRRYRALALRGVGFALIELHRLDEAEQALREALLLEPGNAVALNEIAYIQDLRQKK